MIKSTGLASTFATIAAAGTPPVRAHAQPATTTTSVGDDRVLLATDAATATSSHVHHTIQATTGNFPTRQLLRRRLEERRALQQEVGGIPGGADGAEIASFKDTLLAELKRLEATPQGPAALEWRPRGAIL